MPEPNVSISSVIHTGDDIPSAVDSLIRLGKDGPVCSQIVRSLESGVQYLVDGVGPAQIREESESVDRDGQALSDIDSDPAGRVETAVYGLDGAIEGS